jgi:5-methylcytosine-specific restriction endonuclease McrBC GTP-binding regulatory subunit McrB
VKAFVKKITDWILEKEEAMAKSCAVPMSEIESQLQRVREQKAKLQKDYEESMAVFDDIEAKLEKIKAVETLRCQKKE